MNKIHTFTTIGLLISSLTLYSQANKKTEQVRDTLSSVTGEKVIPLSEIVVSSFRVNHAVKELPAPLAVVGSYNFRKFSSLTLSNVLASEPGISMGSDGIWSTKAVIRGMNENRLVTLVDGNRIETATDLTASLSMIDINDIERVEVIKGAQSSLYGTGAMGGIINIITKDGYFGNKPYFSGNITSGYTSANNFFTTHGEVNTGSSKWYLRLSGTNGNADDIRTPEGILPNSQFAFNNLSAKVGFKTFRNHTLRVQFQNYHATDVGIPGGEAFPGPAEAKYTDISRQMVSADYEIKDITSTFTQLKINYFLQYIQRDVEMIPNTVTITPLPSGGSQRTIPELVVPIGNHLINGAQLQGTWKFGEKNNLIAGIDAWARKVTTERTKYIKTEVLDAGGTVIKTNNIVRGETPIPVSTFGSAGIFLQDEHKYNDRLRIILGGRFDGIMVKNKKGFDVDYLFINGVRNDTPPNQRITFEEGKTGSISWSANAGILYRIINNADLSVSVARAFRAPSLEERFKYIDLGNYVRLGDPELLPERGFSSDLGIRVWKPEFNFQADVFMNHISNMIVETPGQFIYTINTGPAEGTTDTLPALVNANVSKALLYGFDFGLQYNFHSNFVLFASGAYVRGKDIEADANLPQIPPLNGRLGLRYTFDGIGSAELVATGAARQDKIAEGEKETGGYVRYDISFSSENIKLWKIRFRVFAGIDNLTDRSYTNHLATNRGSISVEPGRNIYVRLSASF